MGAGSVTASPVKRAVELEAEAAARPTDAGHRGQRLLPAAGGQGVVPPLRRTRETDAGRGPWLQTLMKVAPITASDRKPETRAAAIAFTWTGLQKAGLSPEALATFAAPFREGMYQEDRLRRLGDKVKDRWQESVIDDGPLWSGNIPAEDELRQVTTRTTVHALLLLYGETVADVQVWGEEVGQALAPHGMKIVHQLALDLQLDEVGIGREHFGFADGMSQPIPFGDPMSPRKTPSP